MEMGIFYLVAFIIIVIVVLTFYFSKKAVIKRKLKKAEQKRIADFRDGDIAKIVGEVEFVDKPLMAPLSNRECSCYYVHIEQKVTSGKNSHWKTLIEEEVACKFLIKDGSQYAFINDDNIKSYIVQDRNYSSGFLNDASNHLEQYLNSKGYESEGFLGLNKTLRYKEGILEKGEEIAVLGKGEWKNSELVGLPAKYGRVLEITSLDEAIYLSDDPDTTMVYN